MCLITITFYATVREESPAMRRRNSLNCEQAAYLSTLCHVHSHSHTFSSSALPPISTTDVSLFPLSSLGSASRFTANEKWPTFVLHERHRHDRQFYCSDNLHLGQSIACTVLWIMGHDECKTITHTFVTRCPLDSLTCSDCTSSSVLVVSTQLLMSSAPRRI